MDTISDLKHRRLLRSAIRACDAPRLRSVLGRGVDVNMAVSDANLDSALTYAVKCCHLETVELLLRESECRLDQRNRHKHTALDEAIYAWLSGQQNRARRYRILRLLLSSGARHLTVTRLHPLVEATSGTRAGRHLLDKLVKVVCDSGSDDIKSALLCALASHDATYLCLMTLALHGADPGFYVRRDLQRPHLPLNNAMLLIRATNDPRVLRRIEADATTNMKDARGHRYRQMMKLLTLSGYPLQLYVMMHLRKWHADTYVWVTRYNACPRSLGHIARVAVRTHFRSNVIVGIMGLPHVPEVIKRYLLLDDL
ncbi:hypothetical protein NP493_675g03093 [Ridgeia piscesae]|uniref:Uncharacterized protein n=1 Tax=Ridgeia piscesae TaxID=27915 RepID=A0AAD9NMX9_RIDPI|nr:hypothetical protein NP493_675g03093 [Ridgeia piscesae]